MYFSGETQHALDSKGRVTIPARYRDVFADGLYITKGNETCLVIWKPKVWQEVADKINQAPKSDIPARKYARRFFGGSQFANLDTMGRVLVPAFLRKHAHIDGEVLIVGVGDEIEMWNPEIHAATEEVDNESWGDISGNAAERGI